MSPAELLAVATLVVGVPLNVLVTVLLWRLSLAKPQLRVLRERAIVATFVLVLTVVFAAIFLNNDRLPPPVSLADTKIITRSVLFAVAVVPALYWLTLYRRRKS